MNIDDKSFFSELIINDNQSFLSEKYRGDDMGVNVEQANQKNNTNSESFISDQSKGAGTDAKAKQRRRKKRKSNLKVDISDNEAHRSKHDTLNMPWELESSDQKHNSEEYGKFNGKFEDIEDHEYNHIKISRASDTSPCIM